MHQVDEFGYLETEIAQVLELPYAHDRFSMLVFLPKPFHTLNELENSMNEILPRSKLNVKNVILSIPRFKCSFHFDVTKTLRDMGVRNAFLPERADFSRITVQKPFFIEAVFQSAEINVDEEGTEAAAATAVAVSEGRPRRFNANRPFLFVMKDNATGVILFIGRIADPSKE
jgi:serpin B